jgi:hypothetical protein
VNLPLEIPKQIRCEFAKSLGTESQLDKLIALNWLALRLGEQKEK